MKPDPASIESTLARLRPAELPAELRRRLADTMEQTAPPAPRDRPQPWWKGWAPGMAAALLLAGGLAWVAHRPATPLRPAAPSAITPPADLPGAVATPAPPALSAAPQEPAYRPGQLYPGYRPQSVVNRLREVRRDQEQELAEGGWTRPYRLYYTDQVTWVNSDDGSRIEMSLPRERIVQLSIQID